MCNARFLLVAGLFTLGLIAGPAPAVEDPNLVGWWKFDEGGGTVAKDSSGHGNDGTVYGNPQWGSGYSGGGLEFDGVDDYVDCGSDPSLDLTAWTITFWLNAAENKNYSGFVIKGLDAAENYEVLGFADGSMHFPITFRDGTRTFVNTAGGTIVVGEWSHFAYSYNSARGRRFYKDGTLMFSDAQSGTPQSSTDPLTIGNERPLSRFVNGIMGDVRIYNRALTDAEIRQVGARLKAYAPTPPDGALAVLMPLLQWTPATFAVFHKVYLGTAPQLTEADLVGPRQTVALLYYVQGLQPGATYYWRVDEIDATEAVQTGDVWSFVAQALTAYHPSPADGAVDAAPTPILTWLPGQMTTNHHLYFGDSNDAVRQGAASADKGALTDPNFTPGALESLATYYWRVDETTVNGDVKAGPVWRFTTAKVLDDFESYNDAQGQGTRIYETWIDGWADGSSGSQVGYMDAPFVERTIVHDGNQAMPMDYNNVQAPFYSEARREFAPAQDWTADGANGLVLYVRGSRANSSAPLYVAVEDASGHVGVAVHPDPMTVNSTQWVDWEIPFRVFADAGVNMAKVKKMYIGVGDRADPKKGGAGRVYLDDIRLTKRMP
jgi:hypothetical protein